MRCLQCDHPNRLTARLCEYCQSAIVPDAIPGLAHSHPAQHYETEQILVAEEFLDLLLDGEDFFAELEEHLRLMAVNFRTFEERYKAEMLDLGHSPEDELTRVLETGFELFGMGHAAFSQFFAKESEDPEELESAFKLLRDGNNYICLGLDIIHRRHDELQEVLESQETG